MNIGLSTIPSVTLFTFTELFITKSAESMSPSSPTELSEIVKVPISTLSIFIPPIHAFTLSRVTEPIITSPDPAACVYRIRSTVMSSAV